MLELQNNLNPAFTSNEPIEKGYDFKFKTKLIKLLLEDKEWGEQAIKYVIPNSFKSQTGELHIVAGVIKNYWEKYDVIPSKETLLNELVIISADEIDIEIYNAVMKEIDSMVLTPSEINELKLVFQDMDRNVLLREIQLVSSHIQNSTLKNEKEKEYFVGKLIELLHKLENLSTVYNNGTYQKPTKTVSEW